MTNLKILSSLIVLFLISVISDNAFAQKQFGGFGNSPFERDFGDVKFLDAYFGTIDQKIEVDPGDRNVPFTVVFANIGSQDITGIRGQLALPLGFSSADSEGSLIMADSDSNSLAGENFYLTFFVNIDPNARIQQYPGTVKVDFSRLREAGVRTAFFEFNFKVTGDSVINLKALDPFLTSLKTHNVVIEISNSGTAPMSNVDLVASNTQTEIGTTSTSTTNVEKVVILESNWDIGNIEPNSSRQLTATVYVPGNLKGETLRIPMTITYYNTQGDLQTVSKIVDFYIMGLINLRVYEVKVIELSGLQMIIGEIINEGNEDALFGFVTIEPLGNSNIKKQTQFIDEIETDSPVPFNIPLEFDGEPQYGEHDIRVTVRYKDSIRDEVFFTHDATIFVKEPPAEDNSAMYQPLLIIPLVVAIGLVIYFIRKRKKSAIKV